MVTSTNIIGNMAIMELIESSPHFSGLSADALEKISRLMREQKVDKDEIVWLEGEIGKVLYFVASGLIKLFKTSAEGREQILNLVRPGEFFGESAVFNINGSEVSAQAMVPSVLYGIEKSDLEALLRDHPELTLNIIKVLTERIDYYMSLVEDFSFKRVTGRLAKILLEYGKESATHTHPNLTQQEMAAFTGTVREVIARSLRTLEGRGIIRLDHRRIIITDMEALKEIAG